ncbi:hypothetical protein [Bacillus amyloliquefaciens]|uniref:hypothetical protein n=1 Tax=Bacillus amyloliquefaciens TaxID=1390 RepID=UPI00080CBA4C|nr:hypothetical protein [Bacillus amyloliquefaciens]QOQ56989.1 hypothetical protein IL989_17820 [Bacillus amyloliquefaciens]
MIFVQFISDLESGKRNDVSENNRQEIGGCGGVKVNRGKTEALHTVITAGDGVTIRVGKRCT